MDEEILINEVNECDHDNIWVGRDYNSSEFKPVYICQNCGEIVDYEEAIEILLYQRINN